MARPHVLLQKPQPHRKILSNKLFEPRWLPPISQWRKPSAGSYQQGQHPCLSIHIPTTIAEQQQPYRRTYLDALKTELQLIAEKQPGPVCISGVHWHGAPASNLAAAELTELVYTTMRQFRMRLGEECYALVDLYPQDCSADTLALLRGLGFKQLLLHVEGDLSEQLFNSFVNHASYYNFQELGIEISPQHCFALPHLLGQHPQRQLIHSVQLKLAEDFDPLTISDSTFTELESFAGAMQSLGFNQLAPSTFQRNDLPIYLPVQSEHIGIGLAAVSQCNHHYHINTDDIDSYLATINSGKLAHSYQILLSNPQRQMLQSITDWFSLHKVVAGNPYSEFGRLLDQNVQQGLLVKDGNRYIATRRGRWMTLPFPKLPCLTNNFRGKKL